MKKQLAITLCCMGLVLGISGMVYAGSISPPVATGPQTLSGAGDGSAHTHTFFIDPGSTWRGGLTGVGAGTTWSVVVTDIDVTSVTGNANRTIYFNLQEDDFNLWPNMGIGVKLDSLGANSDLLQAYDTWTVKSSHGFNPGDLTRSQFDLKFEFSKASAGDVWAITPSYRLSVGSWTTFFDGTFASSNAFDVNDAKLVVGFDHSADGSVSFGNMELLPEPGMMCLLGLGGLGVLIRRSKIRCGGKRNV